MVSVHARIYLFLRCPVLTLTLYSRDENGFKCHTQSESHTRQMMLIGEDPRKHIHEYSQQFLHAFVSQLKTAHGSKPVAINSVYQDHIAFKTHIHMNATRWKSLTEFAKYLGQEGICRVEDTEKGIFISWIDNSPEAMRRQAAVQKQERMEKNDEEWEKRLMRQQIERAEADARAEAKGERAAQDLERREGEKITFSLGAKQHPSKPPTPPHSEQRSGSSDEADKPQEPKNGSETAPPTETRQDSPEQKVPIKMSFGSNAPAPVRQKPRSMAALFGGGKKSKDRGDHAVKREADSDQPKRITEAERVMRQDMERNGSRDSHGISHGPKRIKIG